MDLSPKSGNSYTARADGISSAVGLPYLAPEIVLLFKAKHLETRDRIDFDNALPRSARRRADGSATPSKKRTRSRMAQLALTKMEN